MNLSETLTGIFFRLLNFGAFLALLRYLYIKYMVPTAQADIEADEKKVAILAQQKDAYFQQEQWVTKEIEDQRAQIAHLTKKLAQWQAAAQDAEQAHQQEHDRLEDALRKKAVLQSEHIVQHMLERRALPQAIQELKISLTAHFAGDARGTEYVADVVDHIAKGR
jgi:chromosome segregation ATPase